MFLDDAQDGDLDLLEHGDALRGVDQCHVLRGRHDHRPRQGDLLRDRDLDVSRARGKVMTMKSVPVHSTSVMS